MREMEKLNMQMPEAPQDIIAPLKRLNLMDDFLFDVTTVSLEACKIILELSIRNVGNIPKRTRFYQALVDAPLLKSGEQKFDNLNTTYIVAVSYTHLAPMLFVQGLWGVNTALQTVILGHMKATAIAANSVEMCIRDSSITVRLSSGQIYSES